MEEIKNNPEKEPKITPEEVKSKLPLNFDKKFIWIAIAILVLGGAYFYGKKPNSPLTKLFQKGITQDEAKAKVEKFIADNGGGAEVKGVSEDNGLYKVTVSANGQEFPSYVSKDGTKFFPQAIEFADVEKQVEAAKQKED